MDFSFENIMEYVSLFFTTGVRWVCVGLAMVILVHQIIALLRMRNPSEIWAYMRCPDGSSVPLTHWENLLGRGRGCDIILNIPSVSRSHATLIRDSEGVWKYNDLNSKNGSYINGKRVHEPTILSGGDVLTIGGENFELYPVSLQERMANIAKRKRKTKTTSPWLSMFALTIFQLLAIIQFKVALGDDFPSQLIPAFALLCILMWAYIIIMHMFRRNGFEIEIIAFFLSTLCLAVTASAYPSTVLKQSICILLGVIVFFAMCWLLRDLNRAKRLMYIFIGLSVILLMVNLVFGSVVNGSQNWIRIGGFSFQPSEVVKIVFIYVGAATLDELQQRKNLLIFMGFSVFCLGCLALMGDFGTAIIFFGTFLVISFLRSGDFTKLFLVLGAAGLMGMMVLRFKPYVATRFQTWGHVWDDPTGGGFQQVQTLTSIASGGLPGLGAGEGNLSDVAAASTDLVFGLLCEEWGLIIAVLSVLCVITLGVFAYRSIIAGRSTYYSIAACAATTLFMFQTILNVFGSVDLLPLTGVTFPFVSSGGTSMIVSWCMLAYLKAADTRQNASIAIRLDRKSDFDEYDEYDDGLSAGDYEEPEELFRDVDMNPEHEDNVDGNYGESNSESSDGSLDGSYERGAGQYSEAEQYAGDYNSGSHPDLQPDSDKNPYRSRSANRDAAYGSVTGKGSDSSSDNDKELSRTEFFNLTPEEKEQLINNERHKAAVARAERLRASGIAAAQHEQRSTAQTGSAAGQYEREAANHAAQYKREAADQASGQHERETTVLAAAQAASAAEQYKREAAARAAAQRRAEREMAARAAAAIDAAQDPGKKGSDTGKSTREEMELYAAERRAAKEQAARNLNAKASPSQRSKHAAGISTAQGSESEQQEIAKASRIRAWRDAAARAEQERAAGQAAPNSAQRQVEQSASPASQHRTGRDAAARAEQERAAGQQLARDAAYHREALRQKAAEAAARNEVIRNNAKYQLNNKASYDKLSEEDDAFFKSFEDTGSTQADTDQSSLPENRPANTFSRTLRNRKK